MHSRNIFMPWIFQRFDNKSLLLYLFDLTTETTTTTTGMAIPFNGKYKKKMKTAKIVFLTTYFLATDKFTARNVWTTIQQQECVVTILITLIKENYIAVDRRHSMLRALMQEKQEMHFLRKTYLLRWLKDKCSLLVTPWAITNISHPTTSNVYLLTVLIHFGAQWKQNEEFFKFQLICLHFISNLD